MKTHRLLEHIIKSLKRQLANLGVIISVTLALPLKIKRYLSSECIEKLMILFYSTLLLIDRLSPEKGKSANSAIFEE